MPIGTKKLANIRIMNNNRNVLFIVHPLWLDWMRPLARKSEFYGVTVTVFSDGDFKNVLFFLKKEKMNYDCVVLVPGHGCESRRVVKGESILAKPGIVWSDDALATHPDELIVDAKLRQLVNACIKLTGHLHLCTCHQGCMIMLYNELVAPKHHAKTYVLSGWCHGVMTHDYEVDKFLYKIGTFRIGFF
jgi:hypothetical protein